MILFPLETVVRELKYKMILGNHLSLNLKQTVIIAPKSYCSLIIKYFGSSIIYFDKGYHEGVSEEIYNQIKVKGGTVVSLDEEGAVDYQDMRTLMKRYSSKLFEYSDFIFFWGRFQYSYFKSLSKSKTQSIVSGHPRFYNLVKSCDNKVEGKYLLINTNMSFGNNLNGEEFVISNYTSRVRDLHRLIEFDKKKIEIVLKFIQDFRRNFDYPIILRPHPEEDTKIYQLGLDNYKVTKTGFSEDVIRDARWVIHTDCTTAIEAYFLGKTPISILPNGYSNFTTVLPTAISSCYNSSEELINHMLSNKKFSVKGADEELADWIQNEIDPSEIICEALKGLKKERYSVIYIRIFIIIITKLKALKRLVSRSSINALSLSKLGQLRMLYKNIKSENDLKSTRIHSDVIIIKKY